MAVSPSHTQIDRARIGELAAREEARLNERTQASKATFERATKTLSGGVASSYQLREPWPIYMERGVGPKVWDVDGNEMWDFHNGFGSMVQGHANPAIGAAMQARYGQGTHFAAPTEDAIVVGEHLKERWGLPQWRYTNSGSEATMDAIRIARAHTGRDTIVKIFGCYHGHHDGVMVSIGVEYDKIGDHENLASLPYGAGIPQAIVDLTIAVPFNDAGAMERRIERLIAEDRKPACVIMEAAMMNLGVVLPEPGYLEAVREITRRHGIVLIFDEVKTGLCIAAGGATERFGVDARSRDARQGARRRLPRRRDRRQRGGHGLRQGRQRLPGRHLQRKPALHGRRAREPRAGPDAGRLRDARPPQRAHPARLHRGHREARPVRATPSASARRAASPSRRRRSSTTRPSRPARTPSSPTSRGSST